MPWLWILGGLITLYLLFFFVFTRYIPFMTREPLPARIPGELEDAIKQIEDESDSPYEYIKGCKDYILSTSHCGRIKTITRLPIAFERSVKKLLQRRGFMHCTQLNHLMRVMLARSEYFTDDDIRLKKTFLNFNAHQYLEVNVAGQWYSVDLGADWMGVPLGKHAWGFR